MNPLSHPPLESVWRWSPSLARYLRKPFADIELVAENHSQAWQDLFVLTMLRGLRRGRYLEIGAQDPVATNNSYLMHQHFGWTGVSVEIDASWLPSWRSKRPDSNLVIADALAVDYSQALPLWFGQGSNRIDYLQLDIDPSINTLSALERLPLEDWRFSVITFETDAYTQDLRARDASREILSDHGYVNVAKDVSVVFLPISEVPIPFEDWWVDPQVVDAALVDSIQNANQKSAMPQFLLFEGYQSDDQHL